MFKLPLEKIISSALPFPVSVSSASEFCHVASGEAPLSFLITPL